MLFVARGCGLITHQTAAEIDSFSRQEDMRVAQKRTVLLMYSHAFDGERSPRGLRECEREQRQREPTSLPPIEATR